MGPTHLLAKQGLSAADFSSIEISGRQRTWHFMTTLVAIDVALTSRRSRWSESING